jgi:hypothetical protein
MEQKILDFVRDSLYTIGTLGHEIIVLKREGIDYTKEYKDKIRLRLELIAITNRLIDKRDNLEDALGYNDYDDFFINSVIDKYRVKAQMSTYEFTDFLGTTIAFEINTQQGTGNLPDPNSGNAGDVVTLGANGEYFLSPLPFNLVSSFNSI